MNKQSTIDIVNALGHPQPCHAKFDCLSGGWPCQDISGAGKGLGFVGARSCLVFCLLWLIRLYRPKWCFFEHVGTIASRTECWHQLFADFNDLNYAVQWVIIPVPHGLVVRSRFFLLATRQGAPPFPLTKEFLNTMKQKPLWFQDGPALEEQLLRKECYHAAQCRLRMLGNLVVPFQGATALKCLAACGA